MGNVRVIIYWIIVSTAIGHPKRATFGDLAEVSEFMG